MYKTMKYSRILCFLVAAAVVFGMFMPTVPANVHALSSDEIQGQIQELEAQNQQIEEELAELEQQTLDNYSEMEEVVRQKGNIDHQVALLNAQIQVTQEQISAYAVLIADKQSELDQAQARLTELSEKNRERIRAMEENGSLSYWSVLFKANSFSDFLDRLNMMDEIARADRQRLEDMDQAAKAVAEASQMLQSQKAELEQKRQERKFNAILNLVAIIIVYAVIVTALCVLSFTGNLDWMFTAIVSMLLTIACAFRAGYIWHEVKG